MKWHSRIFSFWQRERGREAGMWNPGRLKILADATLAPIVNKHIFFFFFADFLSCLHHVFLFGSGDSPLQLTAPSTLPQLHILIAFAIWCFSSVDGCEILKKSLCILFIYLTFFPTVAFVALNHRVWKNELVFFLFFFTDSVYTKFAWDLFQNLTCD